MKDMDLFSCQCRKAIVESENICFYVYNWWLCLITILHADTLRSDSAV